MIWYKLKKILPYYSSGFLSNKVDKVKPIPAKKFYLSIIDFFVKNWLKWSGLAMFSLFVIILVISNYDLSKIELDEILKTFITVPLALIGIIIPLTILSIEFLSKRVDRTFIGLYLGTLKPIEIFLINIFYLAVLLTMFFLSYSINISKIVISIVLASVSVPLIATVSLLVKTIRLVLDDSI